MRLMVPDCALTSLIELGVCTGASGSAWLEVDLLTLCLIAVDFLIKPDVLAEQDCA